MRGLIYYGLRRTYTTMLRMPGRRPLEGTKWWEWEWEWVREH